MAKAELKIQLIYLKQFTPVKVEKENRIYTQASYNGACFTQPNKIRRNNNEKIHN